MSPTSLMESGCARCIPTSDWKKHVRNTPSTNVNSGSKSKPRYHHQEVDAESQNSNGFDEGLHLERIVGAKDCSEGVFHLVKFKERDDLELIPALLTFTHAPSVVLHFYATRLSWIAAE